MNLGRIDLMLFVNIIINYIKFNFFMRFLTYLQILNNLYVFTTK